MQVFRPKTIVGEFMGYDIILSSNEPTQDCSRFEVACNIFKDLLKRVKILGEKKDDSKQA